MKKLDTLLNNTCNSSCRLNVDYIFYLTMYDAQLVSLLRPLNGIAALSVTYSDCILDTCIDATLFNWIATVSQ